MRRRALTPTVASLTALFFLTGCSFGEKNDEDADQSRPSKALLVRAANPEPRTMERSLPMTARMMPQLEGEVTARVQGIRILELLNDVGERVSKGQPLVQLETIDLEHTVAETASAVTEAEQRIVEAGLAVKEVKAERVAHKSTIARKKQILDRLKKEGRGVAQDDVDAAQFDLDTEKAKQARFGLMIQKLEASETLASRAKRLAELKHEKALRELKYAVVLAPMNGVITERVAQVGQSTSVGMALFKLYDPSSLVARAKVAQHHLRHIREGQVVRFEGDAFPDIRFTAHIALIEPQVDQGNGMVAIRLKLDADATRKDAHNAAALNRPEYGSLLRRLLDGYTLKPGMFVSGQIVLEKKTDTLAVPRKAISYMRGQPYLYVVEKAKPEKPDDEGDEAKAPWRVKRLYFREGLAQSGWVEFKPVTPDKTLAAEALIVLVGQDRLRDGDPVRLERDQKTTDAAEATNGARSDEPKKD
ncbi:MAG: hypothetical protein CMJ83_14875 [Planctomycetes bacterium]|nr:hypothetical protein [Planctomycetota bacterium]